MFERLENDNRQVEEVSVFLGEIWNNDEILDNLGERMATTNIPGQPRQRKNENFLRQFRDEQSKELKQITATQFMEIWSHYDIDGTTWISWDLSRSSPLGNGYIEGHELDDLLRELVWSVNVNETNAAVRHNCFFFPL